MHTLHTYATLFVLYIKVCTVMYTASYVRLKGSIQVNNGTAVFDMEPESYVDGVLRQNHDYRAP